jgi:hypothetical protein
MDDQIVYEEGCKSASSSTIFNQLKQFELESYFNDVTYSDTLKENSQYLITIRDNILLSLDYSKLQLTHRGDEILISMTFDKQHHVFRIPLSINLAFYNFELKENEMKIKLYVNDSKAIDKFASLHGYLKGVYIKSFIKKVFYLSNRSMLYKSSIIVYNRMLKRKALKGISLYYLKELKSKIAIAKFEQYKKGIYWLEFIKNYSQLLQQRNKGVMLRSHYALAFYFRLFTSIVNTRKVSKLRILNRLAHCASRIKEADMIRKYYSIIPWLRMYSSVRRLSRNHNYIAKAFASLLRKRKAFKALTKNMLTLRRMTETVDMSYKQKLKLKSLIILKVNVGRNRDITQRVAVYNAINYKFIEFLVGTQNLINSIEPNYLRNMNKLLKDKAFRGLRLFYLQKLKTKVAIARFMQYKREAYWFQFMRNYSRTMQLKNKGVTILYSALTFYYRLFMFKLRRNRMNEKRYKLISDVYMIREGIREKQLSAVIPWLRRYVSVRRLSRNQNHIAKAFVSLLRKRKAFKVLANNVLIPRQTTEMAELSYNDTLKQKLFMIFKENAIRNININLAIDKFSQFKKRLYWIEFIKHYSQLIQQRNLGVNMRSHHTVIFYFKIFITSVNVRKANRMKLQNKLMKGRNSIREGDKARQISSVLQWLRQYTSTKKSEMSKNHLVGTFMSQILKRKAFKAFTINLLTTREVIGIVDMNYKHKLKLRFFKLLKVGVKNITNLTSAITRFAQYKKEVYWLEFIMNNSQLQQQRKKGALMSTHYTLTFYFKLFTYSVTMKKAYRVGLQDKLTKGINSIREGDKLKRISAALNWLRTYSSTKRSQERRQNFRANAFVSILRKRKAFKALTNNMLILRMMTEAAEMSYAEDLKSKFLNILKLNVKRNKEVIHKVGAYNAMNYKFIELLIDTKNIAIGVKAAPLRNTYYLQSARKVFSLIKNDYMAKFYANFLINVRLAISEKKITNAVTDKYKNYLTKRFWESMRLMKLRLDSDRKKKFIHILKINLAIERDLKKYLNEAKICNL